MQAATFNQNDLRFKVMLEYSAVIDHKKSGEGYHILNDDIHNWLINNVGILNPLDQKNWDWDLDYTSQQVCFVFNSSDTATYFKMVWS